MYPISKIIKEGLDKKNLTKYELAKKLGYKKITSGLSEIYNAIDLGEYYETIEQNLHKVILVDYLIVKQAYIETIKQKSREKIEKINGKSCKKSQEMFRPFLYVKTKRVRPKHNAIVSFLGYNHFKKVDLPDNILDLNWLDQVKIIQSMIKEHFQSKNRLVKSQFGNIVGYVYCRYYEEKECERISFDVEGKIKKIVTHDFPSIISQLSGKNSEVKQLSLVS